MPDIPIMPDIPVMPEMLEIVTPEGRVIGTAPRSEAHGNNALLHRVVHVFVFDPAGRLLLQKRSMNKDVAAGKWDTSVGGHVDPGESVEAAAAREMAEELGIEHVPLTFMYSYIHTNPFESELVYSHSCVYDGPVEFNPEEIDAVAHFDPAYIKANLGGGLFSDNFEHEFMKYQESFPVVS